MKPYDRRSPVYTGTLTDWPIIRALWRTGPVTVRLRNASAARVNASRNFSGKGRSLTV